MRKRVFALMLVLMWTLSGCGAAKAVAEGLAEVIADQWKYANNGTDSTGNAKSTEPAAQKQTQPSEEKLDIDGKAQAEKARQAYDAILEPYQESNTAQSLITDIDGDGIPELVLIEDEYMTIGTGSKQHQTMRMFYSVYSLQNLLKAIEAGIFTPTTKKRMEELEQQKEDLNISLIRAQMAQPVFTKEEIVRWISRFKYGSIHDKAYQREIIDTFLNSVYVYDDRIVFTYNFRDHAETITLDETEYVFCSDVNNSPPPIPHQNWCGISFAFVENGRILRPKSCKFSSWFPVDHNSYPNYWHRAFL